MRPWKPIRHLTPAIVTLAQAHPSELDTLIDDDRPPEVHDAGVIVLRATTAKGSPIATLVNWANHPETLGSKNTLITADYPYYLCKELEQRMEGVAVFLNGAVGGMQSPLGAKIPDPATKQARARKQLSESRTHRTQRGGSGGGRSSQRTDRSRRPHRVSGKPYHNSRSPTRAFNWLRRRIYTKAARR